MNILILQETDWVIRGPHIQHHLFERLSKNPKIKITVIDYDIENKQRWDGFLCRRKVYSNISRAIEHPNIKVIRTANIRIPYLKRFSSLITNFIEIIKMNKKKRFDLIVSYSMSNGLIGLFFSKIFGIPYIFHYIDILHHLVPVKSVRLFAKVLTRIILKYANLVLVYTKFHKELIINEGCSINKIKILPNGVSLKNNKINTYKFKKLRKELSIQNDDFVLLFMGFLYDFAGLIEIVEYYNKDVNQGKIKLKFLIIGDGGIYNQLKDFIKKESANWVILTGRISFFHLPEYIALSDLCLLSFAINDITKEITPIKIIEYMAMKKPVLSNNLPGVVSEIGKDHGVIFARNQQNLIKKIGEIIKQKEELNDIGLKGYKFVKEHYTWTKILISFKKNILNTIKQIKK